MRELYTLYQSKMRTRKGYNNPKFLQMSYVDGPLTQMRWRLTDRYAQTTRHIFLLRCAVHAPAAVTRQVRISSLAHQWYLAR